MLCLLVDRNFWPHELDVTHYQTKLFYKKYTIVVFEWEQIKLNYKPFYKESGGNKKSDFYFEKIKIA